MLQVVKLLFVVGFVVFVDGKPCGRCNCGASAISRGVLIVNCSDSGISKTVRFPDVSSFVFSEIELESSRNKLESVNQFSGDPITKIDLSRNEIRRIDQESFLKLTKLLELDLSVNKLKDADLSVETFKGLKNLQKLSLYDTAILRLKTSVFSEMRSLKELNLGKNFLDGELDPDLFSPLTNLQVLSLAQNNLNSIHVDTFSKMTQLQTLNISGNSLQEFSDSLLENSPDIRVLDMSMNQLELISTELFKYMYKLEVLDLSHNRFQRFDADMVLAKSVRILDFGHNHLKTVGFLEKSALESLEEVYLQDNLLTDVDFIAKFKTIRVLNVSSNQLSSFPQTLQPKLTSLDLSNNSFSSIPAAINSEHLPSLSHLQLDSNPISVLLFPPSQQPFLSLSYISISNMPVLTTITSTAFRSLKSSAVAKRETDESFHKFVEDDDDEEILDEEPKEVVEKESIEDKNDFVGELDDVKNNEEDVMEVNDLDVTKVDEEKTDVKDKEDVMEDQDLDVTKVDEEKTDVKDKEEEVKEDFDGSSESKSVEDEEVRTPSPRLLPSDALVKDTSTEDEPLVVDPARPPAMDLLAGDVRRQSTQAQKVVEDDCMRGGLHLRISRNRNMDTIEAGAFTGINLCMLDLSGNSLTTIPENMVTWSDVTYIDLQYNPWDCACAQQWLLDTIVPKLYASKPELLYELRCGSPALLLNRRFVHYYNWSEKAFCVEQRSRMVKAPEDGDEEVGVVLKLGDSTGTIIIIAVCCAIVVLLVAVGIFLQWRMTLRRRNRNRRL